MEKRYYIEVDLKSDFNVVVETLTRVGVLNESTLYQTAHLLHHNEKYYIVHFKELFSLFSFKNENKIDKEKIHMNDEDFYRKYSIMFLLHKWGLIDYDEGIKKYIEENRGSVQLAIIKFEDKEKYKLVSKFSLGRSKNE